MKPTSEQIAETRDPLVEPTLAEARETCKRIAEQWDAIPDQWKFKDGCVTDTRSSEGLAIRVVLAATEPQEQPEAPAELVQAVRGILVGISSAVTPARAAYNLRGLVDAMFDMCRERDSPEIEAAAKLIDTADERDLQAAIVQLLEEAHDEVDE